MDMGILKKAAVLFAFLVFLLSRAHAVQSDKSMRDERYVSKAMSAVIHDLGKTSISKTLPKQMVDKKRPRFNETAELLHLEEKHKVALKKQIEKGQALVQEARHEIFEEVKDESALANKAHKRGNNHEFRNALLQVSELAKELQSLVGNETRLAGDLVRIQTGKQSRKLIPKIVHHIYKLDLSKSNAWPNKIWEVSYRAWIRYFPEPEFEHIFWPDKNVTEFFKIRCPEHYKLYQSKKVAIEKADISRYCILRELGGIYADLDYEPRQNFFKDLQPNVVNLVQSPYISETVQNSLMASPPHHPYWQLLMDEAKRHMAGSVLQVSGPQLLDSLQETHVRSGPHRVHILPCNEFQRATKYERVETRASKTKGCRVLAPSDYADKTLKGIHWGTVAWMNGDPLAHQIFHWFHHMEAASLVQQSP